VQTAKGIADRIKSRTTPQSETLRRGQSDLNPRPRSASPPEQAVHFQKLTTPKPRPNHSHRRDLIERAPAANLIGATADPTRQTGTSLRFAATDDRPLPKNTAGAHRSPVVTIEHLAAAHDVPPSDQLSTACRRRVTGPAPPRPPISLGPNGPDTTRPPARASTPRRPTPTPGDNRFARTTHGWRIGERIT